jgi:DNA-binding NarL/FixJ family response regulator
MDKLKVLIVEDSSAIREALARLLSKIESVELAGEADNVGDAIRLCQKLEPDAVILDVHLRYGNGFDVLRTIKRGKHSPVVIMFAFNAYPELKEKCLSEGADFFLDKSTESEKLAAILCEMLEKH